MSGLFMKTPPYYADTFGVMDVINPLGGVGVIDDSSGYHPFNGGRGLYDTGIRMEDVITGTADKIIGAMRRAIAKDDPPFVMLCAAPCASMIATDMQFCCDTIERESKIPCITVDVSGHKPYDNGVSKANEAVAKRLVFGTDYPKNGINIIGMNSFDFPKSMKSHAEGLVLDAIDALDVYMMAFWGIENLSFVERASAAELNVVISVSGLAAAKCLKARFGTPYAVISPIGSGFKDKLAVALSGGEIKPCQNTSDSVQAIVFGEQVTANAVREELISGFGFESVRVLSYFTMDKSLMLAGDKRVKNEQSLEAEILSSGAELIIADEALKPLIPDNVKFVPLPSGAFVTENEIADINLSGDGLKEYLSEMMK